jgi:putative ABC transport system permease protein
MNCGMGVQGKIVGVVDNFHYTSLHSPIEPLVFILQNDAHARVDYLAIKLQTQQLSQSIEKVSAIWQQFDRMHHFNYTFLDERFERQYQREQRMLALFGYFSLIIILISCLGLYGLSAFSIEQRSKEIGIRKVLGSSDLSLLRLLTLSFMKLVLLAAVLSIPVAYFLLSEWLSSFAFRIKLHPLWFVLGVLIAATVAFVTTAIMAWKALKAKPLDSLKYE